MKKVGLWVLLLVSLVGCSTKMGYYFLDWVIEWKLEEYVSLTSGQQAQFDSALNQFLIWHRAEELPLYAKQLSQFSLEFEQASLTPAVWAAQVEQLKQHWLRTFEFIKPFIVPMISSFTDEQVKQVIAQLRVDEKALNRKYLGKDRQALVEMADKRINKRIKKWIGKLTSKQKQAIHEYNLGRSSNLDMWLEYRHEWIRLLSLALKNRHNQAALSHSLTVLMTQPDRLKSDVYKTTLDNNTEQFGTLLVRLNLLATISQKKHFQAKLDALIVDLNELSEAD
ncbi:conserved hypothetical protein [Shewanella halifaxensis HAW-EB4]|uniref:Lipoprotein n=1 Tax=Shewanella halifaxensis (strain HAW-EB4) TaxID=458817 RepID=B0TJL9_SHEHH|nr:DUF6279 family lipoprotein [Shewanella halifaxensis]ABZ77015.1 conserved hypothetical protein [Shewanella halifaxensis HAW-EB4]